MKKKFDPKKLNKLNNPDRLKDIPPDYIWSKLNTEKPDVLVEIGAGTAFFCIAFLQRFNPSTIYACDLSDTMIDWIKENVVPKYPGIIPVKTEEHSVPLDGNIADRVFMMNLHHELENPALTLEEAHRLLKPGREIFIVDWKKEDMPEGPPLQIRYLPEQVKDQLSSAGFVNIHSYNEMPKHFLVVAGKNSLH